MKNFIKNFQIAVIAVILLSQPVFAFYSDVPETNQNYESIKFLYDLGMLPSSEDNLFHPDNKLSTKDFYTMLFAYTKTSLEDSGFTYKNPESLMAKHEILGKLFKYLGIGTNYFFDKSLFPFMDLNMNSDVAVIANKAHELGIIELNAPSLFKMAKRPTKGEVADYLYKINQYLSANGTPVEISINLPINTQFYTDSQEEILQSQDFLIFLDVLSTLKTDFYYKDDLNNKNLFTSAIKGLLENVDDIYTVYNTAEEAESFYGELSGEYQGIGMSIDAIDENIVVISPFKNSPAEKAGIKPNDIILEVDGESIAGLTVEAAASKIRGEAGTTVKLKILRNNEELEFSVERGFVAMESVEYELLNENNKKIGYIEIVDFGESTYTDFLNAANELIKENPEGFIIDLRNNPGGYMNVAIDIIGLFTDKIEPAVILEYANGNKETYETNGNGLLKDYKTVVLINKGSASASEIMAGALQDYDFAKIIGESSFGKGCVQELTQYVDGSMFKYTISKWLTPNENDINEKGLTPDIVVENLDSTTKDEQLEKAEEQF